MFQQYIKEILREYDRLRQQSEDLKKQRREEVYRRVPRIKEIDQEIARLGLMLSKSIIEAPGESQQLMDRISKEMENLKEDRAMLLTENNIPLSYLEKVYHCEQCKDRGFLGNGKKCACFKQKLIDRAYNLSNLTNTLDKENFHSFNIDLFSTEPYGEEKRSPRQNMMHLLNTSEGFVMNFKDPQTKNLLFYGGTGLGKTFLANCVAKALLDRGHIVIYQTSFKMIEVLEDLRFRRSQNKEEYNLLFEADLLIIDDLGAELTNSFTNSELFNLINSRILRGKKIMISTNLSPMELAERYDDRIFSRLIAHFDVLKFYGEDLRWEKQ
ncbi:ATP-binding protein [Isachenkonia alkalipeptolytica]|uniref:DNA replication protein DnaC n=1 Tax=Isachenkonia alkalipeptolytica TaxID=2565777 RepID=A0AA43XJM6_9CLOT|nr:ATP-binding protein [Isachenkonia alkalipeptolytica]NBG88105.1 DNA replication protein DnaC [Isachenkonia alkalipeptolytica]